MNAGFAVWRLDRASWRAFGAWFAVAFLYDLWAINMPSPFTRALSAAGGRLPESQPGFPAGEPLRSLEALGPATGDYLLWQWLDIPYAFLAVMMTSTAMALGLKSLRPHGAMLKPLLWVPLVYFGCEIVENTLVELFAARVLAPAPPAALLQQLATSVKFAAGYASLALAALGAVIAATAALVGLARRGRA